MGILALDQRTGVIALRIALAILVTVVHRTEDIGLAILTSLLILHRTGAIVGLHPIVGFLEVWTIASLVTQRPHDDARMVLKRAHITFLTLDMCLSIILTLGQRTFAITHTMTLDIRLSRHIDAVFVAEVIPAGIIGIVARTNGIDIQILHDLDILDHAFHRDKITTIGIEFVTVSALNQDRLAVDEQLSTFDFNMTEANALIDHLQHLVALFQHH